MSDTPAKAIDRAAEAIASADAILIAAGAGMGVDSGLPDFRGAQGFWKAYPPYAKLALDFASIANPEWFVSDPPLAWGFYGHRLMLYRRTIPHPGFAILGEWARRMPLGGFVFTSNVDGHFQRAGFQGDQILEVHGAVDWLQCLNGCGVGIFSADSISVDVDESTFRAAEPLPSCPQCGSIARPNILMFGDYDWDGTRSIAQRDRLEHWCETVTGHSTVIIECGAGTAIPSVRRFCEQISHAMNAPLIRINPREPDVPKNQISLPLGALEALRAIDARLQAIRQ